MIPLANEEEVHAFMKAVYPGFSDLALAVFSEKIALREATELITRLREERDALRSRVAELEEELKAELDGKAALRGECGAKENETFSDFVRRLANERDALRAELDARKRKRLTPGKPFVPTIEGDVI